MSEQPVPSIRAEELATAQPGHYALVDAAGQPVMKRTPYGPGRVLVQIRPGGSLLPMMLSITHRNDGYQVVQTLEVVQRFKGVLPIGAA